MSLFSELYKKAYDLFNVQNYAEAQTVLNKAEAVYEDEDAENINREDIEILRGSIALSQNDIENARDAFENALKQNNKSAEACMGLGQIFYLDGMKNEAKSMFEWAVNNEPDNKAAESNLSKINSELGFPASHNSLVGNIDDVDSEYDFSSIYEEAYNLFLKNKFEDALQTLSTFDDKYEEDIFLLKGDIFLGMDKLSEAKATFEKVLRANPESVSAYIGLGEYFYKNSLKQDAKTMYEHALSINPNDEFALLGLAKINQDLGLSPVHSLVGFFSNSEVGEELNSKIEDAYKLFGEKNFNESIAKLNEALQLLDSIEDKNKQEVISQINNFVGFNQLAVGDIEKAKAAFEFSLKINSESSQACAGLAEVFYLLGNDKEAKTMYEWAVKNNNVNAFAVAGLAKVNKSLGLPAGHSTLDFGLSSTENEEAAGFVTSAYEKYLNKDFGQAVEFLQKAESLFDENPVNKNSKNSLSKIHNFKGFCNLALNKSQEARADFEKALSLNPESSQACAGLGEVFYLMEQDKEALEMYEWAVALGPKNKFALSGLEKVNKILDLPENDTEQKSSESELLIEDAYKHFEDKDYESALDKLMKAEQIIEQTYDDEQKQFAVSSINNFMGFNYLAKLENGRAKTCFEKALENNSTSSQACAGLGEVLFLEGNDEEAKKMYEWAVKNNPENRYALGGLGKINKLLNLPDSDNSLMD